MVNMRPFNSFEQENIKFLVNHNVKFTQVEVTSTGLKKGILDSTTPMRAYFLENGDTRLFRATTGHGTQSCVSGCDIDRHDQEGDTGLVLPSQHQERRPPNVDIRPWLLF